MAGKTLPEALEAEAEVTLSAPILRCRVYGHAWEDYYPDDMGIPLYGWRLSLICRRCLTERHDIVDRNGHVGGRRYVYPDGYLMAKGQMPTRDELRQRMLDQVRNKLRAARAINERIMEKAV